MKSLHEVAPDAAFSIDTEANELGEKPELAILVARVFASWATVEAFIGLCANSLLSGRSGVAEAVYGVLSENSLQYAALYAAADAALPREDAKLFREALKAIRKLGQGRHMLAHGVYASCDGIADLVIYEQRDFAKLTRVFFTPPQPGESRQEQTRRLSREAAKGAKVVGADDLRGFIADIDVAAGQLMPRYWLLQSITTKRRRARASRTC